MTSPIDRREALWRGEAEGSQGADAGSHQFAGTVAQTAAEFNGGLHHPLSCRVIQLFMMAA